MKKQNASRRLRKTVATTLLAGIMAGAAARAAVEGGEELMNLEGAQTNVQLGAIAAVECQGPMESMHRVVLLVGATR